MAYIKLEHNINTEDYRTEKLAEIVKQIKVLEALIKETKSRERKKELEERIYNPRLRK